MTMLQLYLLVPLAPLAASVVVGLFGAKLPRSMSHWLTILGVAVALVASFVIWRDVKAGHEFNGDLYTWLAVGSLKMSIGFLIDPLTALMMLVVTFVSLMVHVYTIGYMADDPGYSRFFSYISLFTFAMLMLVMSNNFLQLFFGWEAVGLVSYLLIGFWFTRPDRHLRQPEGVPGQPRRRLRLHPGHRPGPRVFRLAGLRRRVCQGAFARRHDGQYLGHGRMVAAVGDRASASSSARWARARRCRCTSGCRTRWKGPRPSLRLIHAATMVTAGIFLVARMSPLFELSDTALSFVTIIGAIGALFMGFLGMIQFDIKRVVAYSTLSQLGYMTVALGVSAYAGGIFHLMTHAFFKALLFLGAGSVIIAMHHEQDMRHMGGLRKYMPITYWTMLIGSLALCGIPPFAGFFSKDAIIEAVHLSKIPGHGFAYFRRDGRRVRDGVLHVPDDVHDVPRRAAV